MQNQDHKDQTTSQHTATATGDPRSQPVINVVVSPNTGGGAAHPSFDGGPKSIITAYLLWFFLGALGFHRFYLGRPISAVLYLFTLGFLGIGWLIDMFLVPGMVRGENFKALSRA